MALTGFDMSLLSKKYDAMMKSADADLMRGQAAVTAANRPSIGEGLGGDPNAGLQQNLLQAQIKQAMAQTNAINVGASAAQDESLRNEKAFDQGFTFGAPTAQEDTMYAKAIARLEQEAKEKAQKNIGGQKRGIAKVPGKGSGHVDTVHAKLAPGEAVLNKAAAEHLGRGVIKALNALGRQKMGMV